jgi:hypothetical protein
MRLQQRPARTPRRATAAVELALLLPFLVLLFLGSTDFARIFYVSITIENSLENAALFSSQTFDNQNQQWIGNQQYWQGPNGQLISAEKVAAEFDGASLNPALADSNVSVSAGADADGNAVKIVTVTYRFETLIPYPGLPSPVTITRTAQVRIAPATPS